MVDELFDPRELMDRGELSVKEWGYKAREWWMKGLRQLGGPRHKGVRASPSICFI